MKKRVHVKIISLISLAFIIFLSGISSGIHANFSCPENVEAEKEFECSLTAEDFSGNYDVKVELVDNGKTIAKIKSGSEWKSAYYYLPEFIKEEDKGKEKKASIMIIENIEGEFSGLLKLRQNSKVTSFNFTLNVLSGANAESSEEDEEEDAEIGGGNITDNIENSDDNSSKETKEYKATKNPAIHLNPSENDNLQNELEYPETLSVVYESKNQKIKNYLLYAFCIFLILIIIFLLLRR